MPSVTTIEGVDLGYDDQGHIDELDELLDAAQHELQAVGDAPTCKGKFAAIIRAHGTLSDAMSHAGAIEGAVPNDEVVADRINRLNDHMMKVRDEFQRACLRD